MELHDDCEAVRRERVVTAERARVWAALASPQELGAWIADELILERVEPGAEGIAREGRETRFVRIEEVQRERRLALAWWPATASEDEATLVDLTLEDEPGGGTRVVAVEVPLRVVEAVAGTLVAQAGSEGPQLAAAGWR